MCCPLSKESPQNNHIFTLKSCSSIIHVIVFRTKLEVRVFEETSNLAQLQLGLSDRVVLVVDQGTGWSGPIRYGHYSDFIKS